MKNNKVGEHNSPKPQAWIAVSNNRQKLYGTNNNLVYLDDDQEFQIELYNPTSIKYLAKIYVNGELMSSAGLVLKPGQRYFLDRHIDVKKKLVFSTYEVEDTEEVAEAIKNNGSVKVEFYGESKKSNWVLTASPGTSTITVNPTYPTWTTNLNLTGDGNVTFGGSTVNTLFTSTSGVISGSISGGVDISSGSNSSSSFVYDTYSGEIKTQNAGSLETGRVETGKDSNQNFDQDHGTYLWFSSFNSEYKILPRSAKPIEVKEIREYCTECGTRIKKKGWKFCPSCGEKLS